MSDQQDDRDTFEARVRDLGSYLPPTPSSFDSGGQTVAEFKRRITDGLNHIAYNSLGPTEDADAIIAAIGDMAMLDVEHRVVPCDCQPCEECEAAALAEGSVRQSRYVTAWFTEGSLTTDE